MGQDFENNQETQTPENGTPAWTDPNAGAGYQDAPRQENGADSYTYGSGQTNSGETGNYQYGQGGYGSYQDSQGSTGNAGNPYGGNYNAGGSYGNSYGSGYNPGYQNGYQTPNGAGDGMDHTPLTMGEWLLTLIAGMIPCFGLIIYLVWAFGKSGNINRRNFCRANLILQVVGYVLLIIFVVIITAVGVSSYGYGGYYYY